MNKLFSRISFFVLAALVLGGFPNFMVQEAFAVRTYDSAVTGAVALDSTNTKNIILTFSGTIYTTTAGGDVDKSAQFAVTTPTATVTSAIIKTSANAAGCVAAGALSTVTLVLQDDLPTGAKPIVTFTNDATILSLMMMHL